LVGEFERQRVCSRIALAAPPGPIAWWRWASAPPPMRPRSSPAHSQTFEKLDSLESRSLKYISEIKNLGQARHFALAQKWLIGLCYWANTPFTLDLYIYGQKLQTGVLPIRHRAKTVFQAASVLSFSCNPSIATGIELLPESCNQIINENYHPDRRFRTGRPLWYRAAG